MAESVVANAAAICKIGTIDVGDLKRVGQAEDERKKSLDEERKERYAARANDFPLQFSTRDYRQFNSCLSVCIGINLGFLADDIKTALLLALETAVKDSRMRRALLTPTIENANTMTSSMMVSKAMKTEAVLVPDVMSLKPSLRTTS